MQHNRNNVFQRKNVSDFSYINKFLKNYTLFGVLVIIGKKVGEVTEAAAWALESFCKQRHLFKKSMQTVLTIPVSSLNNRETCNVFIVRS